MTPAAAIRSPELPRSDRSRTLIGRTSVAPGCDGDHVAGEFRGTRRLAHVPESKNRLAIGTCASAKNRPRARPAHAPRGNGDRELQARGFRRSSEAQERVLANVSAIA